MVETNFAKTGRIHFLFSIFLIPFSLFLVSCESEAIRQQEVELRRLREELARQKAEIEEIKLARLREEQKRQDCNRAFRNYFEKAQREDPQEAVSLYRQGLQLCPDDDVARYELAKILERMGHMVEAEKELEAALRINPDFLDAKRGLESIRKSH